MSIIFSQFHLIMQKITIEHILPLYSHVGNFLVDIAVSVACHYKSKEESLNGVVSLLGDSFFW